MTIDQELMLHQIETVVGEITLDTLELRDLIESIRTEYRKAYEARQKESKETAYQLGYEAGIDEARAVLAGL